MPKFLSTVRYSSMSLAVAMSLAPAMAASPYTFVSASGSDSNSCATPAMACATLQKAVDEALTGGVVTVLGRGNFLPVSITKAISIVADDGAAGIIQNSTNSLSFASAVYVSVASNEVVSLRGLMIDQRNVTNAHGITFLGGGALHVENCVIRRTNGSARSGINFVPETSGAELTVSNCSITDGGASAATAAAITIRPGGDSGGSVKGAVIDRVRMENYSHGLVVDGKVGSAKVTVRDSVIAGNSNSGILATRPTGSAATTVDVTVRRTDIAFNNTGASATGASVNIWIGDSTLTANTVKALSVTNSGKISSYGTNVFSANTSDGTAPLAATMK